MAHILARFWTEEDGNAVVDWVVLLSGLVLLTAAVTAIITPGAVAMANDTGEQVESNPVGF